MSVASTSCDTLAPHALHARVPRARYLHVAFQAIPVPLQRPSIFNRTLVFGLQKRRARSPRLALGRRWRQTTQKPRPWHLCCPFTPLTSVSDALGSPCLERGSQQRLARALRTGIASIEDQMLRKTWHLHQSPIELAVATCLRSLRVPSARRLSDNRCLHARTARWVLSSRTPTDARKSQPFELLSMATGNVRALATENIRVSPGSGVGDRA